MPISQTTESISWKDQISEEEVQALIESKINSNMYYAIDELWKDMFKELTSQGVHLGPDLITLVEPIWNANLPVS